MATRPTTLRGMFILALNTFAINTRVPGIKIAEKIGKMFEAAVEEKQARAGRGSKKETLQQIASEISASFPRWQKLYPGARRERVIAGGKVAWHYTRTENIALLPKDLGEKVESSRGRRGAPAPTQFAHAASRAKVAGNTAKGRYFRLAKRAIDIMKEKPGKRFSAGDLAREVFKRAKPEDKALVTSEGKSVPDKKIASVLENRMQSSLMPHFAGRSPSIRSELEGGRRFFYFPEANEQDIESGELDDAPTPEKAREEAKLYPLLARFLYLECSVYSKIVAAGGPAHNGATGVWLHPDVVGLDPVGINRDWEDATLKLATRGSGSTFKLWSCEVKNDLRSPSAARKAFFQAVANSSWAHYGYLVAAKTKDASLEELRLLSSLHGIGFISLDATDVSKSRILFPARERPEIDWSATSKLSKANRDVKVVLQRALALAKADDHREESVKGMFDIRRWDIPDEE